MQAMDKGRFDLQLERLNRHYIRVRKKNDPVALVDLFHALRMWTEIATQEISNPLLQAKTFRTSKLQGQRDVWNTGEDYFYISMGSPCFGERFHEELFMPQFAIDEMNAQTLNASQAWWPPTCNRPFGAKGFYFGPSIDQLDHESAGGKTLPQFMQSKCLWFRKGETHEVFSVQEVIERLSNGFIDASHFQLDPMANDRIKDHNRFKPSAPLMWAMKSAGVPLTVFVALYFAQELLINLGKTPPFKDTKKKTGRPLLEFKTTVQPDSYNRQAWLINIDPWLVESFCGQK